MVAGGRRVGGCRRRGKGGEGQRERGDEGKGLDFYAAGFGDHLTYLQIDMQAATQA
jgi:hypothetical protein